MFVTGLICPPPIFPQLEFPLLENIVCTGQQRSLACAIYTTEPQVEVQTCENEKKVHQLLNKYCIMTSMYKYSTVMSFLVKLEIICIGICRKDSVTHFSVRNIVNV